MKWAERRRRARRVQPARSLVSQLLEGYKLTGDMRERKVLTDWRRLVGERIAQRTWPDRIQGTTLYVRVTNSAWRQELAFMIDDLIERINADYPEPVVDEIKFFLDRPRPSGGLVNRTAHPLRTSRPLREIEPASGMDLARINAETDVVEDDELRAIIREARRRVNR